MCIDLAEKKMHFCDWELGVSDGVDLMPWAVIVVDQSRSWEWRTSSVFVTSFLQTVRLQVKHSVTGRSSIFVGQGHNLMGEGGVECQLEKELLKTKNEKKEEEEEDMFVLSLIFQLGSPFTFAFWS